MMGAGRFGLTWWGQRWIAALEAVGVAYANRLPRGRSYAAGGTVTDLKVLPGVVTARVVGSRDRPYRVTLKIPAFGDAQWDIAFQALAAQVRHAAALLDGRIPEDIDEIFAECGLSLFPGRRELSTSCNCPDVANPCKHVVAVHYVLAQHFDADPFLLPTLRGRDRDQLLAGLRAVRSGTAVAEAPPTPRQEGVPLSALTAASLFDSAGPLDLPVHPREPRDPHATLHRLGAVPGLDPAALEEAVTGAAERAWRLAADPGEPPEDPVLRELYARGTATPRELSEAAGVSMKEVRAALRQLIRSGVVHRTGHARTTRYHA